MKGNESYEHFLELCDWLVFCLEGNFGVSKNFVLDAGLRKISPWRVDTRLFSLSH